MTSRRDHYILRRIVRANLFAFAITNASKAHFVWHKSAIASTIFLSFLLIAMRVKTTGRSTDHCITHKKSGFCLKIRGYILPIRAFIYIIHTLYIYVCVRMYTHAHKHTYKFCRLRR